MITQHDAPTRPGEISRDEARKIAAAMDQLRHGGRIVHTDTDHRDSRLTRIFEAFISLGILMTMALLAWVGSSMVDLKVKTAELSVAVQPMQAQIVSLAGDVADVKRDVAGVKNQVADIQERQRQQGRDERADKK